MKQIKERIDTVLAEKIRAILFCMNNCLSGKYLVR